MAVPSMSYLSPAGLTSHPCINQPQRILAVPTSRATTLSPRPFPCITSSRSTVARSKFEQFEAAPASETESDSSSPAESSAEPQIVVEDSVLPDNLQDAIVQSSKASALFATASGSRAVVEILVPDLETLGEEGSQQLLWNSTRIFLDELEQQLNGLKVKAVYPDAGAAALLSYQWKDAKFSISSLSDRQPVDQDDDVIVLVTPDFQMLPQVQKVADFLSSGEGEPRTLVMWNPRLVSGDVGVGLNVRRLRENFLSTFTSVYHLRPLSSGAVFRSYPQPWKLFLDNPDKPGRYLLYREQNERPDLDDIEDLFLAVPGSDPEKAEEPSLISRAVSVVASLSRFMKALSN